MFEGSLEVKLPTIWTHGKAEAGRVREERAKKREEQRRERVRRKKMQVREKVGKSRFTVFLQWSVALGGRKVGSLKRRVRSHLAWWEMKKCTRLWREAHFQVKMYKAPHSDHSWKFRCRKNVRRCGAKHIPKSKVSKTGGLEPFLTFRCRKKSLPNCTNWTNLTTLTNLTNTTHLTNLTNKLTH